jgi:hypothetical protein
MHLVNAITNRFRPFKSTGADKGEKVVRIVSVLGWSKDICVEDIAIFD